MSYLDIGSLYRTKIILQEFNNPQDKLKNVFYVTGTTGKTSIIKYISSIMFESGYSIGAYTSGHAFKVNERVSFNKLGISDNEISEYMQEVERVAYQKNVNINFFEKITVAAIIYLSEKNSDINLIEVGNGGFEDPTNLFENNENMSYIISPIDIDHKGHLGSAIELATFKLMLPIKPYTTVISGKQNEKIKKLQEQIVEGKKSRLLLFDRDFWIDKTVSENAHFAFSTESEYVNLSNLESNLKFQTENISTALMAIWENTSLFKNVTEESVNMGIAKTKIFGQIEKINSPELISILPKESEIYVDFATNATGIRQIGSFMMQNKSNGKIAKGTCAIISRSKFSENTEFLKEVKKFFDFAIYMQSNSDPSPETKDLILEEAEKINLKMLSANSIEMAMQLIKKIQIIRPTMVFFCGSSYIAKDISKFVNINEVF